MLQVYNHLEGNICFYRIAIFFSCPFTEISPCVLRHFPMLMFVSPVVLAWVTPWSRRAVLSHTVCTGNRCLEKTWNVFHIEMCIRWKTKPKQNSKFHLPTKQANGNFEDTVYTKRMKRILSSFKMVIKY